MPGKDRTTSTPLKEAQKALYNALKKSIRKQLHDGLKDNKKLETELSNAWHRTTSPAGASSTTNGKRLIPFIGSGLNYFGQGGLASWEDLVRSVRDIVLPEDVQRRKCSRHEFESAKLNNPQKLEFLLAEAKDFTSRRNRIASLFKNSLGNQVTSGDIHDRLLQLFPVLVTTNYNILLETKGQQHFDLTDPKVKLGKAFASQKSVLYLHGRRPDGTKLKYERAVFWGIGSGRATPGPCLILTEHQYHRLYSSRPHFQRALARIFAPDHFIMFMGSGLSNDEFGIHEYLRELQLGAQAGVIGMFIAHDLTEPRAKLLWSRGLLPIRLPDTYGWGKQNQEATWHAFLDVMEERFGETNSSSGDRSRCLPSPPTILCVGIASRHRILGLTKAPKVEVTRTVLPGSGKDEIGGQHMIPALRLALHGHHVAIATAVGDDNDGDWILERARCLIRKESEKSERFTGDLHTFLIQRRVATRQTWGVTYPGTGRGAGGLPPAGTRLVMDQDSNAEFEKEHFWRQVRLESWPKLFGALQAVYLGKLWPEFQKFLLGLPQIRAVPLRFFETGTGVRVEEQGPSKAKTQLKNMMRLAKQCTHVLSSAFFCLQASKKKVRPMNKLPRDEDWQRYLFTKGYKEVVRDAFTNIFGENANGKVLVVTLGRYGVVWCDDSKKLKHAKVKVTGGDRERAKCWMTCGDCWRGEFIRLMLQRDEVDSACRKANVVAAKRVRRWGTYEDLIKQT